MSQEKISKALSAKLAALIGWTSEPANNLLAETLEMVAGKNSGGLEGFSARSIPLSGQAHNAHWIA